MDEKSMIIEQERQAKAKKRKKYRKLKYAAGILAVLLIGSSTWYMVQGRYLLAASKSNTVEIVAGTNQEIVYAYIETINGNEITYRIMEEPVTVQTGTEKVESSRDAGQMPEGMEFGNGQMPEGMDFSSGEMPDFGGEMPDFGGEMPDFGGEMPDFGGGEMPDFGSGEMPDLGSGGMPDLGNEQTPGNGDRPDMPNTGVGPGRGGEPSAEQSGEATESTTVSEETYTKYIPVGTDVTTKLGTVTTFSRLAAGDTVALIMENEGDEQVIVAVYIVG